MFSTSSTPADPICTLAAMYHDVVYYQVDQGFTPEITAIIIPNIYELEGEFYISKNIPVDDRLDLDDSRCL